MATRIERFTALGVAHRCDNPYCRAAISPRAPFYGILEDRTPPGGTEDVHGLYCSRKCAQQDRDTTPPQERL